MFPPSYFADVFYAPTYFPPGIESATPMARFEFTTTIRAGSDSVGWASATINTSFDGTNWSSTVIQSANHATNWASTQLRAD